MDIEKLIERLQYRAERIGCFAAEAALQDEGWKRRWANAMHECSSDLFAAMSCIETRAAELTALRAQVAKARTALEDSRDDFEVRVRIALDALDPASIAGGGDD